MDIASFLSALEQIYPTDRLLVKQAQLAPYESDALTSHQVRPIPGSRLQAGAPDGKSGRRIRMEPAGLV